MATTVTADTIYEGSTIIIKKVHVESPAGDESAAESVIIDLSTLVGPDDRDNQTPTGKVSLMEATWTMSPTFEYAEMYWDDEGNNATILNMTGDSSISFRGMGGLHYVAEVEAGDGDVLMDFTNATETAGIFDGTFVFKKKQTV